MHCNWVWAYREQMCSHNVLFYSVLDVQLVGVVCGIHDTMTTSLHSIFNIRILGGGIRKFVHLNLIANAIAIAVIP